MDQVTSCRRNAIIVDRGELLRSTNNHIHNSRSNLQRWRGRLRRRRFIGLSAAEIEPIHIYPSSNQYEAVVQEARRAEWDSRALLRLPARENAPADRIIELSRTSTKWPLLSLPPTNNTLPLAKRVAVNEDRWSGEAPDIGEIDLAVGSYCSARANAPLNAVRRTFPPHRQSRPCLYSGALLFGRCLRYSCCL